MYVTVYVTTYGGGGCHVPARPYVPASLDHLRVEGHDLRDAQGRTGTHRDVALKRVAK